ncbi:hypothetical protein QR680_015787 [Steinernema hermaphroditum]|uniref:G-protein coupled receptors family 1 profile domain-containing protein n=1 Tax=Steinernema hermaphroditum TaxID=289476 RepID=A0AA39LKU0_9BILA|nr:hypothetical protein QR680_015787 [Steinernema hermaphroditum]
MLHPNDSFVYGSEIQGRGEATTTDVLVGTLTFTLALFSVGFGILNLWLIKKMPIFHTAFGCFWASRTLGEILNNLVHVVYSGPVTIIQSDSIPPWLGIAAYHIAFTFVYESCAMHQIISLNRLIAVCFPLHYKRIFKKKTCKIIVIGIWTEVLVVSAAHYVIPCNYIGYGPRYYENVFVKCSVELDRDYSIVGTVLYRTCWVAICIGTICSDLATFSRILYLRFTMNVGPQDASYHRDVRFFAQTSIQNITMTITATAIVLVNNRQTSTSFIANIITFDGVIFTHLMNAMSLVVVNPEVRKYLRGRCSTRHRDFSADSFYTIPSRLEHEYNTVDGKQTAPKSHKMATLL